MNKAQIVRVADKVYLKVMGKPLTLPEYFRICSVASEDCIKDEINLTKIIDINLKAEG